MLKWTIILTIAIVSASGCTAGHRVYVNGYAEQTEPIARNAALYVATDPNSPNPIFERQIKANAETLLRGYGYTVADAPGTADYRVSFQVGMKSAQVTGYTPVYRPHFGPRGGYPNGLQFGFSTYVPYIDTLYDHWLILRLFKADSVSAETPNLVWVGEAMMSTNRAELRETVGYLLIGGIEYLGIDTERKVTMTIKEDDPRLAGIGER